MRYGREARCLPSQPAAHLGAHRSLPTSRLRHPLPPILHKEVLSICLTKRIERQRPEHGHELGRGPQSPADAGGSNLRQVHLQDPPPGLW